MTETGNAAEYLIGILRGDSALMAMVNQRVYLNEPHPEARTPFVLVTYYESNDASAVNAARIFTQVDYTARVVAKAKDNSADAIARRVDELLHKSAPNQTLKVLGCARQKPVNFLENDKGVLLKHTGGIYRVYAM
jgi:hypothetical protein